MCDMHRVFEDLEHTDPKLTKS